MVLENPFWDMGACALVIRKNRKVKFEAYNLTFYIRTSSFVKFLTFFVACVKKLKMKKINISWKIFLAPIFIIFYTWIKNIGFSQKRLYKHIEWRDLRTNFCRNFSMLRNEFRTHFKNREQSICFSVPKRYLVKF